MIKKKNGMLFPGSGNKNNPKKKNDPENNVRVRRRLLKNCLCVSLFCVSLGEKMIQKKKLGIRMKFYWNQIMIEKKTVGFSMILINFKGKAHL